MARWLAVLLFLLAWPAAADDRLDLLMARLPAGWTLLLTNSQLELARQGEVYVLPENRINAPMSRATPEEISQRIRSHGRLGRCRLTFRLEPRWSEQRWTAVLATNQQIQTELNALPERFQITPLYSAALSRKGQPSYIPKDQADAARIQEWQAEHQRLSATFQPLPDHSTTLYSLFLTTREGAEDDLQIVDPPQASRELYQIETLLGEVCPPR